MKGASQGYTPPPEHKRRSALETVFWLAFCGLGSAGLLALAITMWSLVTGSFCH